MIKWQEFVPESYVMDNKGWVIPTNKLYGVNIQGHVCVDGDGNIIKPYVGVEKIYFLAASNMDGKFQLIVTDLVYWAPIERKSEDSNDLTNHMISEPIDVKLTYLDRALLAQAARSTLNKFQENKQDGDSG